MPTKATVAHVLVSRYADHLPLYRQSQILARQGIEIGREVLADWASTGVVEFVPVIQRMREILLASARLLADVTTMPVMDPGRGRTKKGYAWAIARDNRPWGGSDPPAVVFHYASGRGAEHAKDLLGGYRGILQCNGYGAYKALAAAPDRQAQAPGAPSPRLRWISRNRRLAKDFERHCRIAVHSCGRP